MEAVNTNIDPNPMAWLDEPLIDVDFMSKPLHTLEEFENELCKRVGRLYGLNDIREAQ